MRQPAGYVWGAGHAAELPYLFRNMTIGTTVLAPFSAADARLSREMQRYWGAFVRTGRPDVAGQPAWTEFGAARRVLSLRPGGQSQLLPDATLAAEHKCAFWEPMRG